MPLTTTKALIYLDNGQSVQTKDNSAAEIAGLVNAGTPKIYTCTDALVPGVTHNIIAAHIVDVYEVPA